jgi:prepilin-type N-terminal cleavage/methylation domain-containing protein
MMTRDCLEPVTQLGRNQSCNAQSDSHRRCIAVAVTRARGVRCCVMRTRGGYTLLELIVVLAILSLAAAVTLPALLRPRIGTTSVQSVIESARDAAARRGETVYLRIESSGAWHMEGGGSPLESDNVTGRIAPISTAPLTILVAPAGSCAFDVRSTSAARALALDPLSCTLSIPKTPAITASSS